MTHMHHYSDNMHMPLLLVLKGNFKPLKWVIFDKIYVYKSV